MKKVLLGVNIDHVATVRQARRGKSPDILEAALACVRAGADGITMHLREDRRHIQDADVLRVRKNVKTSLNLEMSLAGEIVDFACRVKPDEVCIVPEKRQELTTEGGLDVLGQKTKVAQAVKKLHKRGIRVSIFVDPVLEQISAAGKAGADCVELHTGAYAGAKNDLQKKSEFRKLEEAGQWARILGLTLNAGHGLDYDNVVPVAKLRDMHELNIGFSIIAASLFTGLTKAVRDMKHLINKK